MFDIGFSELVLIGLLALFVLGPKRLPEVARAAGRWMARLRRFIEDTKREIDREIKDADLAALKDVHREIIETRDLLSQSAAETLGAGLNEPFKEAPPKALAAAAPPASAPETPPNPQKYKKSPKSKNKRARKTARRKPHARRKARAD